MMLTLASFKVKYTGDGRPYFAAFVDHERKGPVEIDLEPCFSGFCVGAYDPSARPWPELLVPKRCTNTPVHAYELEAIISDPSVIGGATHLAMMAPAVELANQILQSL